jgi:signal transduction histidine kinase
MSIDALRAWRRLVLGALIALASIALCSGAGLVGAASTEDEEAGLFTLDEALVAPGEGASFPAGAGATRVALPDEWATTRPEFKGSLWYRFDLPKALAAGGTGLRALYIPRVCSSYEVHLNGQLVARGGRMREPLANLCHQPQLVSLPAALLRGDESRIDIRVVGHRLSQVGSMQRAGALAAPLVGPHALLAPLHARHYGVTVGFAQGASATLLLLGGFMFVLGYVNRNESKLAYFGALAVALALYDARLWLREWPFGPAVVEFVLLALLGVAAWAAVQFILRTLGRRLKAADIGLPAQCAALALSLIVAGDERVHAVAMAWYAILALEVGIAMVWLARERLSGGSGWAALTVFAGVVAAVALDALSTTGAQMWPAALAGTALPLMVVLVGLRLVLRHGQARNAAELQRARLEESKAELEARVSEATAEIERNLRHMAELKAEQVAEKERKRIAADLHDDLGAKLLTIVHTSESDRISTLAREALEEMRLSVRGLTGRPVRLADAMGDWRAETMSRLAQAGIEGEWRGVDEAPQMLSSRAYVQTTRILREATSNIIKHSGASHCSVRCATTADNDFQLVIQDNGEGISSQEVEARLDRGHGLASMKNRAKQLQGQCLVESGAGYGTVIRLTLPLDRAAAGS